MDTHVSSIQETVRGVSVRGDLHEPPLAVSSSLQTAGVILAHGAGSSRDAPLLVALAAQLARRGHVVLRCDLPFRQARPSGPPSPRSAGRDRDGLRAAVDLMRDRGVRRMLLGGQSYGGRQSSLLLAEEPTLASGLVLLSYPLHPPSRPGDLRVAHFRTLHTPSLFVHGTRDPFGSPEEMEAALALLPAPHHIVLIEGAGHDLAARRGAGPVAQEVVSAIAGFFSPR